MQPQMPADNRGLQSRRAGIGASSDEPQHRPCPFCGHLVASAGARCERCKLALDANTVRGVQRRLGPWFLLDANNPTAPGVNWEKLVSLIKRGKVAPESIVRGPSTGGLWRLARETPSVATRLGTCWSCQAALADRSAQRCPQCGCVLNGPLDDVPAEPRRQGAAGEFPSPSAIDDLIHAASPAGPGVSVPGNGQDRRRPVLRVGGPAATLALLLGAAACAGIFWWVFRVAGDYARTRTGAGAADAAPEQPGRPPDAAGRSASPQLLPGEPFPEQAPMESPAEAPAATRESRTLSPEQLDRQRRDATALFEKSRALESQGQLAAAQAALLELLNRCDPDAWPEGASAALERINKALNVGTGSRPSFFGAEPP